MINDVVWYSESGMEPNTLVRFDPATGKFQIWKIPSGGGVVRNVSVAYGGNVDFRKGTAADLAIGRLVEARGRLSPDGTRLQAVRIDFRD